MAGWGAPRLHWVPPKAGRFSDLYFWILWEPSGALKEACAGQSFLKAVRRDPAPFLIRFFRYLLSKIYKVPFCGGTALITFEISWESVARLVLVGVKVFSPQSHTEGHNSI